MIIIIQLLTEDEVGADHVNKEHVEDQKEKVKLEHRGVSVRLSIVTNLREEKIYIPLKYIPLKYIFH